MLWGDLTHGFCEGILSGPPEYVNSFTSLAMTFYGLMGLFVTKNHNILIRIISALLAVTGIGSFVYHWTWYVGWSQVDGLPMLLCSYLGAYQALDSILYKKLALDTKNKRSYEFWSGILGIILMSFLVISLALSVTDDTMHWFSILFAIPELMIAVAVLIIRFYSHSSTLNNINYSDVQQVNDCKQLKYAFKIMYIGMSVAIAAAALWITTENICFIKHGDTYPYAWIRYFYAHGFWHIFISLGMYFLMQFLVFIYSFNKGLNPYFADSNNPFWHYFYILVPAIELSEHSYNVNKSSNSKPYHTTSLLSSNPQHPAPVKKYNLPKFVSSLDF